MNSSIDCIVCKDTEYNKPGSATICQTCQKDPILVFSNLFSDWHKFFSFSLTKQIKNDISNLLPYSYSYIDGIYIYPIKQFLDIAIIYFKDSPKKLSKIIEYKEKKDREWKLKRDYDNKRTQIMNTVTMAAEKLIVPTDFFETNTVIEMIENRFERVDINDLNLPYLIINDLSNHALLINNKEKAQKLIASRVSKFDKFFNDQLRIIKNISKRKMAINYIKGVESIKEQLDDFTINDKGDKKNLEKAISLYIEEIRNAYGMMLEYQEELAKYGITF